MIKNIFTFKWKRARMESLRRLNATFFFFTVSFETSVIYYFIELFILNYFHIFWRYAFIFFLFSAFQNIIYHFNLFFFFTSSFKKNISWVAFLFLQWNNNTVVRQGGFHILLFVFLFLMWDKYSFIFLLAYS